MNNPNRSPSALDFVWILIEFRTTRERIENSYGHRGMPKWEARAWNIFDAYLCSFVDSHGGDSSLLDSHGNPIGI